LEKVFAEWPHFRSDRIHPTDRNQFIRFCVRIDK
jgi:hypothetical protein